MKINYILLLLFFSLKLNQTVKAQEVSLKLQISKSLKNKIKKVAIRGNTVPLSWEKSIYLTAINDSSFSLKLRFNQNSKPFIPIEYKFLINDEIWEDGENRWFVVLDSEQIIQTKWNETGYQSELNLPLIEKEKILADFDLAWDAYKTMHPGLERYRTKSELEAHYLNYRNKFSENRSLRQVYKLFSEWVAYFQCGHTYANFYNQNRVVKDVVLNQNDKLPFTFTWLDNKMMVLNDVSGEASFSTGSVITKINGVSTSQWLDSLLLCVKADGDNNGKRIKDLEIQGFGEFEAFDSYFSLYCEPINGYFEIEYQKRLNAELKTRKVKSISRKDREEKLLKIVKEAPRTEDDLWSFSLINDSTAYLKLGTFGVWNMKMDWKEFLQKSFKEIEKKKVGKLILDVRGNEGGADEVSVELSKYLINRTIQLENLEIRVKYDVLPQRLKPFVNSWNTDFYDIRSEISEAKSAYYTLKNDLKKEMKKQKNAFEGTVVLLIDEANSSATFYLAKLLKRNGIAQLIGRQTGGSVQGINGGQMAFLKLPNSGIELDIPLMGSFYDTQERGGIYPDIFVPKTMQDIVLNKDVILEKAIYYHK